MKCAWQAYINLLPVWMRQEVDMLGRNSLQELRLRLNSPPILITADGTKTMDRRITLNDLQFCVNMASKYSPWAAHSMANGYITAQGGHRLGLCGDAICEKGVMTGIHTPSSLCLRVARDYTGIADKAASLSGSLLIIGKPGSGKTTLLRDLIRQRSDNDRVAVVDEREEIFPRINHQIIFSTGRHTDVLSGCRKRQGIEVVLRNMTPETIAVDEITAKEDCEALIHAGWCGVRLLGTAHAANKHDLMRRPVYRPIVESGLFDTLLILHGDKSWHSERMKV